MKEKERLFVCVCNSVLCLEINRDILQYWTVVHVQSTDYQPQLRIGWRSKDRALLKLQIGSTQVKWKQHHAGSQLTTSTTRINKKKSRVYRRAVGFEFTKNKAERLWLSAVSWRRNDDTKLPLYHRDIVLPRSTRCPVHISLGKDWTLKAHAADPTSLFSIFLYPLFRTQNNISINCYSVFK